ncbi:hypothetical protein [Roseibium algae]|uniref:Uncharacterized protein n=1 Tax=Roseibium algae TaxID=3123038 RepID=A0ABU8TEL0_9HYPH
MTPPASPDDHVLRLRRLTSELGQLEKRAETQAGQLNLLLLKHELQELIREMKAKGHEITAELSLAHSASQAAGAYLNQANRARSNRS